MPGLEGRVGCAVLERINGLIRDRNDARCKAHQLRGKSWSEYPQYDHEDQHVEKRRDCSRHTRGSYYKA